MDSESWLVSSGHRAVISGQRIVGSAGAYILENNLLPWGGGISAAVIWVNKYEKAKRKREKI